jgi:serine/threonine protein kinase
MQTDGSMLPAIHATAISRLVGDLAHAPECDPRLARRARLGPGDVVGRFELVREIGRGGFGVVFEGLDREAGRRVAIKTIRRGAPPAAACECLAREREASRLRHPNIGAVLEGGRFAGGPFVVLEYLSGETLAQRLARGPLPVADAIRVAVAAARALRHAHERGVLHRDLKPANVFLPRGGEPKVIDFGLSRVSGRPGPRGSGTSGYMSPEQRRGDPEDERTDLFALGLLLLEATTGRRIRSMDGVLEPGAGSDTAAAVPPDLGRIVGALLERDPDRRPGSADAVLRSLLRIQRRLGGGPRIHGRCEPVRAAGGARRATGPIARGARHGRRDEP